MRTGFLFTITVMFTIGLSAFASDPSLVAYWPMDGNADDVGGNLRHGVAVNGPLWSADGVSNECLYLDGVDDYVDIPGFKGIAGGASRTCVAWINTSQASGEVISWGEDYQGGRWIVRVNEGGQLRAEVQGGNIIGTTLINDGQWHHIAVTLEDDGHPDIVEAKLYVDGYLEAVSASVDEPVNTGALQNVQVGMYYVGQRFFNGYIDEVKIFDRALSELEVIREFSGFAAGSGIAEDPFQISTPEQLMAIGSNPLLLDKHFILTNDIVFDPDNNPAHVFTDSLIAPDPDETNEIAFSGHFDGDGYQIVNLKIVGESRTGLFGGLKGSEPNEVLVKDLTLVNPFISGPYRSGSLAGRTDSCKVENCHVIGGTVYSAEGFTTGGLIGSSLSSIIDHCTSSADVSGGGGVGGLGGGVGGLVGTTGSASIYHSSASGNVTGNTRWVGGLVGYAAVRRKEPELLPNPEIVHCSATGNVHSDVGNVGGLIGSVFVGLIQDCSATGLVTGGSDLGGLVGSFESGQESISRCFASGSVEGRGSFIGGLVGNSGRGLIKDCYALGNVSSASGSYVGGLIGGGGYPLVRCYSTGTASGVDYVGGLVGYSHLDAMLLCYWDRDASGTTDSDGGIDKSTAEMMSRETFKGWGDGIWVLDEGNDYPRLAWEGTAGLPIVDDVRPYSGGAGTEADPYQIGTADDLVALGYYSQDWDRSFELINDIVLDAANLTDPNVRYDNANFSKIGFMGLSFTGHFNGNFHSITGLRNNNPSEFENGLFGRIQGDGPDDVVVENLIIRDAQFSGESCHGGLAGGVDDCKVIRCGVEDSILTVSLSGYQGAGFGCLAGYAHNSTITQCYVNNGRLNLNQSDFMYGGGLVGSISNSRIENSYAICTFNRGSANWYIAGLIGHSSDSDIYYCYTVPTVNSNWYSFDDIVSSGSGNTNSQYCYSSSSTTGWEKNSYWDYVNGDADGENDIWRLCIEGVGRPYLSWEFAKDGDFACGDGVGMPDLIALAENWLTAERIDPATFSYACDADGDEEVTLNDFVILSQNYGPSFDVSENNLDFSAYQDGDNPALQAVTIINSNLSSLDWDIDVSVLPSWLTVTPASGSLALHEMQEFTVSIDIAGLPAGVHSYPIAITDLSGNALPQTVTVNLDTIGPSIYCYWTPLQFDAFEADGTPKSQYFKVENRGGGTLHWSIDITMFPSWLTVSATSDSLLKNEETYVNVSVNVTGLPAGQYSYDLEIVDPNASNSPRVVPITLDVIGPEIELSSASVGALTFEMSPETVNRNFRVRNVGGGSLSWNIDISSLPDWLVGVSPISGILSRYQEESVTVSFNALDLLPIPPDVYMYTMEVFDPNASNTPQTIEVRMSVLGPRLSLSGADVSFEALEGGANPPVQTIQVTNVNGGILNWSADLSGKPDWLTVSPAGGALGPNESEDISLSVDMKDVAAGLHTYSFEVSDPNASFSPQTVNVSFQIIGPTFQVSQKDFVFQAIELGSNPPSQQYILTNTGGGVLNWNIDTTDKPSWLSITPISGVLGHNENENISLSVEISGLPIGFRTHSFEIVGNDTSNSPQTVTVNLAIGGDSLVVPNEFPTIQSAIDAVTENGTVTVLVGTYFENIQFKGKNCILTCTDPNNRSIIETTVIDGSSKDRVILFDGTETANCVLRGFTVTNGSNRTRSGGGIYGSDCFAKIESCIISNNYGWNGGGVCYHQGDIINCEIINNTSSLGAAGLDACDGDITDCIISGNTSNWDGGGLSICRGAITNCVISNNRAGSNDFGGGLYGCSGTITDCIISDNWAGDSGGGLSHCNGAITNCAIINNSTLDTGGGLYACDAVLTNCTIINNTAYYGGGGLCEYNGPIVSCLILGNITSKQHGHGGGLAHCSGPIINAVIVGNQVPEAYADGGGLYDCTGGISNCIIWGNSADIDGDQFYDSPSIPTFSCIQDWTEGGEGNITSDPMFADVSSADPANWDLRLLPGSGCIDAGTNSPTGGLPATDLDGNPRPVDGDADGTATADMGAYEYQP